MAERTFEIIAFWDTCAWVVGTTTFNSVAQGRSLRTAIQRLRQTLLLEIDYRWTSVAEPLSVTHPTRVPLPSFVPRGNEIPEQLPITASHEEPRLDRTKRYIGSIIITYNLEESCQTPKSGFC